MITKEEVKHIAKLARLGLTEKEIAKFQRELSKILDYIEKLKEVDISGIEPTSHSVTEVENVMREDDESSKFRVKSSKLLELAPETKEGYLKVKSITRAFAKQK
jgi:aspartyl-tRNA(Asn)/glutamyl-tRNA(Gln) amidotransferase subunit C